MKLLEGGGNNSTMLWIWLNVSDGHLRNFHQFLGFQVQVKVFCIFLNKLAGYKTCEINKFSKEACGIFVECSCILRKKMIFLESGTLFFILPVSKWDGTGAIFGQGKYFKEHWTVYPLCWAPGTKLCCNWNSKLASLKLPKTGSPA